MQNVYLNVLNPNSYTCSIVPTDFISHSHHWTFLFCSRFSPLYKRAQCVHTTVSKFTDREVAKCKLGSSLQGPHHSASHDVLWKRSKILLIPIKLTNSFFLLEIYVLLKIIFASCRLVISPESSLRKLSHLEYLSMNNIMFCNNQSAYKVENNQRM